MRFTKKIRTRTHAQTHARTYRRTHAHTHTRARTRTKEGLLTPRTANNVIFEKKDFHTLCYNLYGIKKLIIDS